MEVTFRRCNLYKETYMEKIKNNSVLKEKLRQFMEVKRQNPQQQFGKVDKFFLPRGTFTAAAPRSRPSDDDH